MAPLRSYKNRAFAATQKLKEVMSWLKSEYPSEGRFKEVLMS
jgi:hypothetical protein